MGKLTDNEVKRILDDNARVTMRAAIAIMFAISFVSWTVASILVITS